MPPSRAGRGPAAGCRLDIPRGRIVRARWRRRKDATEYPRRGRGVAADPPAFVPTRAISNRYVAPLAVVDGIWDDHDFGVDNAHGATFSPAVKDAHKGALLDFLGARADDARRRPGRGVWAARRVGDVDVVLLDGRYARSETPGGSLLGDAQFRWLERHLAASASWAVATIVVSPVQVLATAERPPPAEGFFEFPDDRRRLLGLLRNRSALLVSGDVHYAELSAYACADGRVVPEMTTSGLTHAWGAARPAHYDGPVIHRVKHWAMALHQTLLPPRVWRHQYTLAARICLR